MSERANDKNHDESDDSTTGGSSGFIAGMLFGLLAGAALAMIAAPQSGEDTRGLLRAKARETADRMRDTVGDVNASVSGQTNELLERGRTIVDTARSRIDNAVADGKDAAERQRNELEDRT
jgi:gas vesicle protein